MPVSIVAEGHLVYVANAGATGGNYAGFSLSDTGVLTPLPRNPFLVAGDGQTNVILDRSGKHLLGTRAASNLIDSLVVTRHGQFTPAPGSPFPSQGPGPLGSAFNRSVPLHAYVSNAFGGTKNGSVSAFAFGVDGTLTSIGSSPFPDNQSASGWVALAPDGLNLFAANFNSDSISSYAVGSDGSLTLVGSTLLRGGSGSGNMGPVALAFDARGGSLYVLDYVARWISIFAVSGGGLDGDRCFPGCAAERRFALRHRGQVTTAPIEPAPNPRHLPN